VISSALPSNFALPSSHDARTEKALHDALDLATLKIMLWRLRAQARIFARWPLEPINHGKANAIRSALRIRRQRHQHQVAGEVFRRSSAAAAAGWPIRAQQRELASMVGGARDYAFKLGCISSGVC
jgi:hypothetical protein